MKKLKTEDIQNDLNLTVTKAGDYEYINEECMTAVTFVVKANGDVGCSYFGAQSEEILEMIDKVQKKYLKKLKSDFKLTKKQKKMCDENKLNKSIKVKKSNNKKSEIQKKSLAPHKEKIKSQNPKEK